MRLGSGEIARRMEAFAETCRERGLRVTPQRMEIFRELASTDEHPDAETVHRRIRERMPTVALDTVYRTLNRLEEEGLISRVQALSERVRFDANMERHHHFICLACGLIRDFTSEELDAYEAPAEVRGWGEIRSRHMEVRGVCRDCLGKGGEGEAGG